MMDALFVAPVAGRALVAADAADPGAERAVVLSRQLARRRFGNERDAIGKTVTVDTGTLTVVGVMPAQFSFPGEVRLALGARIGSVRALVLRQGLGVAMLGVGLGLAGALALGRLLTSLLYEVSPADPLVLAAAALTLSAVSALACVIPAIRATRVDPLDALRSE